MQLITLFLVSLASLVMITSVVSGLGYLTLSYTKLDKLLSPLANFVLANILAFSALGAFLFLGGHILGTTVYYTIYPISLVGLYGFFKYREYLNILLKEVKKNKVLFGFGCIGAIILASTLAGSWIETTNGLYTQSGQLHDSVWHIAVIQNLSESIPPLHPSNYQLTLTHYHYFYDIIIASFAKTFFIPTTVLYFQVLPFYLSFLLYFSALALGETIKDKLFSYVLVFLTFFGGGFTYLIPLFLPGNIGHESSFWVSQTFTMMINPQLIYSFSLVFCLLFLIRTLSLKKIDSTILHTIIIFLTICSIGFKSYSFIVLACIYFSFLFYTFIQTRQLKYILYGVATISASLPLVLMVVGNSGSSTFFLEPLWFINTMVETPDRLNIVKLKLLEDFYRSIGEYHKVLFIKVIEIFIFYIGNLGSRSLLFFLPLLWFLKKNNKNSSVFIFVICISFIMTSVFPLLFLQVGIVWNSIQFWYYTLIIANVGTALLISHVLKNKNNNLLIVFSFVFISINIVPFIQTIPKKIVTYDRVPAQTINILKTLKSSDIVLVCPETNLLYSNSLVTGYSKAKSYYVDTVQLALTGEKNVDKTEKTIKTLMNSGDVLKMQQFFTEKKITSVICNESKSSLDGINTITTLYIN